MCRFIKWLQKQRNLQGLKVYFDTNCYRGLARAHTAAGLDKLFYKIVKKEKQKGVDVRLSYLVVSEMFSHLHEPPGGRNFQECKGGLQAAIAHVEGNLDKLLPSPDMEFYQYFFHSYPNTEAAAHQSLKEALILLSNHSFDDAFIHHNKTEFLKTDNYLLTLQNSWADTFIDHFIKKHDPSYTGGWQVYAADKAKRATLLKEIRKEGKSGQLYREFALGMYQYIGNNYCNHSLVWTNEFLDKTFERFKSLFLLQLRIIELMCSGGYNLQKKPNDIIDYMIMASFTPADTIFVSNETAHLVPYLHSFGYHKQVMSLSSYFKLIGM